MWGLEDFTVSTIFSLMPEFTEPLTQYCQKRISIKNSSPELDQLEAAVARDERQKWQNKTEIEKNEEEIKSLGLECTSKVRMW